MRETYYRILLSKVITITQDILLLCRTLMPAGLHGNVWEGDLEIQDLNLFRVSPKYSCFGALKKYAVKEGC